MITYTDLPGGDLIIQGLADFAAQQVTPEPCLIAIARGRLQSAGVPIPSGFEILEPEHRLYYLLGSEPPERGDAYARYNALIRRLISFSQALENLRAGDRKD